MSQLVTLKIDGMTCASCVARVEKTLLKIEGVDAASVNLASEKAQIRVSGDLSPERSIDSFIQAIQKAGFEASRIDLKNQRTPAKSVFNLQGGYALSLAALLSAPLVLPMLLMPFSIHAMLPAWIQFLLATPVQFLLGSRFYIAGFRGLRSGSGNMDLLIAIGTSAAYGLSIYEWDLSGWGNPHQLYFESSAVVIALVMLGKWLEARAKQETTEAISALQALWPNKAKVLKSPSLQDLNYQNFQEVPIDQVLPGDLVAVLPGERVPVDGLVVDGESELDESMLTGETHLIMKALNATVTGGSMNGAGRLIIKAISVGEESTLAKMIQMVEDAQAKKAPIQRLVDQVSSWFVPAVIGIAITNFMISYFVLGNFEIALIHSVAILVIACPCALGLATPVAMMAGTGVAAKLGILIKDAQALELAHRLNIIAFDKTGTLTIGQPQLMKFSNLGDLSSNLSDEQVLSIAMGLQMGSEHPMAKAVIHYCEQQKLSPESFKELVIQPGKGIQGLCSSGQLNGRQLFFISHHGLIEMLAESDLNKHQQLANAELIQGHSVSWLVELETSTVLGMFAFGDQLKPGVADAIARLKSMNIQTIMISGDNRVVAQLIAKQIGIDQVFAEVMPADKARIIQELQSQSSNACIAMVGDGVNDAPALAAADVGIAMSTGTDIAIHVSGITLMRGDPALVPDAIEISKKTWQKIKQNLFWAFIYNLIGIPLAAMGYLTPVIAGAAMAASSVSVISNALLLKRWARH
ncbi:MAG: hypothetical protein RLZZ410_470 [Pseudomonadota bacterium]|jgi:Cu+-exporting ATPase